MSFDDHNYSKRQFILSEYARNLDYVAKSDYVEKLTLKKPDNSTVWLPDPYFLDKDSWNENLSNWPKITISEIESYLIKFPGRNTRSREAFNYVTSGKVQNMRSFTPPEWPELIVVSSNVYPSMKSGNPHWPWVLIAKDEIRTAHCTCLAGLGEVCSHVTAILYTLKFAADAEVSGVPTEKRCRWNNSFSKVKAAPLQEVDLKKMKLDSAALSRPISVIPIDDSITPVTEQEFEELRKISPDSVIFTSYTDDSSTDTASDDEINILPPLILQICKEHLVTDVESLIPFFSQDAIKNLELKTRSQRNTLWIDHRRGRITSSNFGEVLKKKSVSEKFVNKFLEMPKKLNVPAVNWGIKNEAKVFEIYYEIGKKHHTGFSLRKCGLYISQNDPYLGSSPDGITDCKCCGTGVRIRRFWFSGSKRNCFVRKKLLFKYGPLY